ncbi:ABC transporter ATP-binding protein [Timonella sp. A28]|uniref:ABC transporter ATP-binding protein n=1 Tax=Timonella sp. A28 TaxID=3442640 RepID=UPI003EBFB167
MVDVHVTGPMIAAKNLGVEFSKRSRNMGAREFLTRGRSGVKSDRFWAVKDVSFEVQPGEAIGLIGRNGGGKSTLLKLVSGVMIPDSGSVSVNGPVAPLIELTGGFVPDLTAHDNIYLAAGLHGMPKKQIDELYDEIVEFAEIREFLQTPFRHFSSGMKVRLAFAVMSRVEAPVLLVDEVLAVGDKAFREKCYTHIEGMLAEGKTLFLVSHSDKDLKRFCTRGLYMRKGQLALDAPLKEALAAYHADAK